MATIKSSGIYLFLLIGLVTIALSTQTCPSPFVPIGSGCYYFSPHTLNWFQSFEACSNMSAHLLSIENADENNLIKDYLVNDLKSTVSWWMGLTDDHQEGVFMWVNTMTQASFVDWGIQDPNNVNGENCVGLSSNENFLWQDASCDDIYGFNYICQLLY